MHMHKIILVHEGVYSLRTIEESLFPQAKTSAVVLDFVATSISTYPRLG